VKQATYSDRRGSASRSRKRGGAVTA
jgi:hypothetical protein